METEDSCTLPLTEGLAYALSFLVPAASMVAIFAILQVYPFGDNTLLVSDMGYQYIDFLSYYKSILVGNNDIFYSFSRYLGDSMLGLWAYYLASPVNLIVVLFPETMMPLAAAVIIALKAGLCGLAFQFFLRRAFPNRFCCDSILFSVSYALSAYFISYYFNIMWLDGMVLLPLVIWGIHNIIDEKKPLFYTVSLFAVIATCYYIGYMVCLFTVVYFVYLLAMRANSFKGLSSYRSTIICYVLYSILSVCLAAVILIPTYLSLQGGRIGFSADASWWPGFELGFSWFAARFFSNSSYEMSTLPNVFCGILPLILLVLFFLNRRITAKEKVLTGAVLAVMIASFAIPALVIVWHAFNEPHTFPARYSFAYIFFVLVVAYRTWVYAKKGIKRGHLLATAVVLIGTVLFLLSRRGIVSSALDMLLIVLELLLIFLVVFKCLNRERSRGILILVLACLQFGNLFGSSLYSINNGWNTVYGDKAHMTMSEYSQFVATTESVLDSIPSSSEMQRIEKTYGRFINDPMQFAYNGTSHAASGDKSMVKDFLGDLGLSEYGRSESAGWASYGDGSTVAVDSLLGIRYLLSESEVKPYVQLGERHEAVVSNPPYVSFETADVAVYENPFALSLGFAANDQVLTRGLDASNTFETQNDMYRAMVGSDLGDIFTEADNSKKQLEDGVVEYTLTVAGDGMLYMQNANASTVKINGEEKYQRSNIYDSTVFRLDDYQAGETLSIEIVSHDNESPLDASFYYENTDLLGRYIGELEKQSGHIEKISSSHLVGHINVSKANQVLLLTIPYDNGWSVWIDGQRQEARSAFGTLTAVPVGEGEHSVELKYMPAGFVPGLVVSVIALCTVAGMSWARRIRSSFSACKSARR